MAHSDRYHLVYIVLILLGAGVLLPYNAYISAPDYFSHFSEYASNENSNSTKQYSAEWNNIESYFTLVYSLPNIIAQLVVVAFGRTWTIQSRLLISIAIITLSMLAIPIVSAVKTTELGSLIVLLTAVAVCGAASAVFQCTVFGFSSYFPPHYVQAVMFGSGCAGFGVSLLRIATKAIGSQTAMSDQTTSTVYFAIGIAWMVICVGCIAFLRRSDFAKYYVKEFRFEEDEITSDLQQAPSIGGETPHKEGERRPSVVASSDMDDEFDGSIRATLALLWKPAVGVFMALFVSLTVFPGLAVNTPPQPNSAFSADWFAITIVTLFNMGDALGRMICRFKFAWISVRWILIFATLRLLFIPYFIISATSTTFHSDALSMTAMLVVGITSGWLASLCMMYGGTDTRIHPSQKEMAGNVMSFALLFGVLAGSFIALPINQKISG